MADERLLTPSEVAQRLSLSENALARARCEGDGPPFLKIGSRTVRYPAGGLTEWLAGKARTSTRADVGATEG